MMPNWFASEPLAPFVSLHLDRKLFRCDIAMEVSPRRALESAACQAPTVPWDDALVDDFRSPRFLRLAAARGHSGLAATVKLLPFAPFLRVYCMGHASRKAEAAEIKQRHRRRERSAGGRTKRRESAHFFFFFLWLDLLRSLFRPRGLFPIFFLFPLLSLFLSFSPRFFSQVNDALAAAEALLAAAGGGSSSSAGQASAATRSADKVELRCDVNGCSIVPVSSDAPARDAPPNSFFASVDEFEAAGVSGGEGGGLRARSGKAASSTAQQSSSAGGAPAPVDFRLAEGPGWRLGYDAAALPGSTNFSAVAGGDGWSAAMTRDEYDDLVRLLANLQKSVATLSVCGEWGAGEEGGKGSSGGDDEAALEMSSARVWVQGRAPAARLSSLQAAWAKTGDGASAAAPSSPLAAFELRFILLQGREVEGVWPAEAVAGVLANLEGASPPPASAAAGGAGSSSAAAASNPVAATT